MLKVKPGKFEDGILSFACYCILITHPCVSRTFKDTFVKTLFFKTKDILLTALVIFFSLSPSLTDNAHISLSVWSSSETLGISAEDIHKVERKASHALVLL